MFNLILLSQQIRFSITANRLIHFFRRIPIIKNAFSESVYGDYTLKKIFTVFGFLYRVSKKILFRLIYIGSVILFGMFVWQVAMIGGPFAFLNPLMDDTAEFKDLTKEVIPYIFTVFFIFSFFGSIINARVVHMTENDDIMINYLRTDPAMYAKSNILVDRVFDLILYLPFFVILFAIAGMPLSCTFLSLIVFTSMRLCGEFLNLLLFRYIGKTFANTYISLFVGLLATCCAFLIPVWQGEPDWTEFLQNPFVIAGAVFIGAVAGVYIVRYSLYPGLLRERISAFMQQMEAVKKKSKKQNFINLQEAKNWSKNIREEDLHLGKYDKKKGFAYLNAIFFDRHSKFFNNKLRVRSIIILVVCTIVTLFGAGFTLYTGYAPINILQDSNKINSLFYYAPLFFFIIYIVSMGRVVTASIFSNCDIEMLHYSYYRTKEMIFDSFKARFLFVLRCNLQITTILAIAVIIAIRFLSGYMDLLYAGVFFVLLTCIGIFFAFNDLFLYYVIQPYDSVGQTKSITYSIINGVVYLIAYMNLQLRFNFIVYSIVIIVATFLYLGAGTGMLLKFAPKNFKLR